MPLIATLILAALIVLGMAFALLYPSLSLVAINSVPESRRGSALGTFTAFFAATALADTGSVLGWLSVVMAMPPSGRRPWDHVRESEFVNVLIVAVAASIVGPTIPAGELIAK